MINNFTVETLYLPNDNECNDYSSTPLDELPLAMAYVPKQKWKKLYEPDVALERGTIFSELDLPFLGKQAIK